MKVKKRWTPEEDAVLRNEALAETPVDEIARKTGRTESAVRSRAYVLRIEVTGRRPAPWTPLDRR
jgi:hypothetical protein